MRYKLVLYIILCIFSTLDAEDIDLSTHVIHIEGQRHFDVDAIHDVLSVDTRSFFAFWRDDIPSIKSKLLPTLKKTLESFYNSEGFYDAKFETEETNATVNIEIKENTPVKVTKIETLSDFNISVLITFKKGKIFRAKEFTQIKSNIIEALLNEGYCSYDLDTKAYVDLEKHSSKLVYKLKKGGICTFGEPNIKGLESIDEEVIISRIRAKKGKRFDPRMVQQTYVDIFTLDSFDSVQVNVDRKFYNVVPIDITLREIEKGYHFRGGAGYDTFTGAGVHASIVKRNFLGNAQKIGLRLLWSQREQLAIVDYFKPALFFLFDYGIDFGTELGYSNLEFVGFQEEKKFARFYLEHNEGRLRLRSGLALENISIGAIDNIRRNEILLQAINEGDFVLFYPYLDAVYDARDDKLNPKYGYYLAAYLEYGMSSEAEASAYTKTLLEARYIHTFDKLTLASVGKMGAIEQRSGELPESKFFFAGGIFSNRAYGFNTMGVILSPTSDTIAGASSMLNLSFEANYPIWESLYGAVFTDNTMLNEESYDFSGPVISSVGLGVRYLTPAGPFKLDVGFNVNRPSQFGISFQIGQSF